MVQTKPKDEMTLMKLSGIEEFNQKLANRRSVVRSEETRKESGEERAQTPATATVIYSAGKR